MTAPWPREAYTAGGGAAEVALIALSTVQLPDPLPVSRGKHGMPDRGAGLEAVSVVQRVREQDATWFATNVLGPFASLVGEDLGEDSLPTLAACAYAYVIEAKVEDPEDLGHLQAAWGLAQCVCECAAERSGAVIVIDVHAARAHAGAEVAEWAADRGFDLMREVTLFFEQESDDTLVAWTLGMRKVGRPDLVVTGVPHGQESAAAVLLRDVGTMLAAGDRLEPGDRLEGGERGLTAMEFIAGDGGDAPVISVEGPALRLVADPA